MGQEWGFTRSDRCLMARIIDRIIFNVGYQPDKKHYVLETAFVIKFLAKENIPAELKLKAWYG